MATASLPDGAVTTPKLADGAVTGPKLANNSVSVSKLSFQTVFSGSLTLNAGANVETVVQNNAPNNKTTIYFPAVAVTSAAGGAGATADITAQIVYRQTAGSANMDLYIRLSNLGTASAQVFWQVLIFSN